LFTIGKSVIGLYIGSSGIASSYGAAGALLILLLWVYYSAQIFLLGANTRGRTPKRTGVTPLTGKPNLIITLGIFDAGPGAARIGGADADAARTAGRKPRRTLN
jgi:hypothetical protein